jgi:hypothetical protein
MEKIKLLLLYFFICTTCSSFSQSFQFSNKELLVDFRFYKNVDTVEYTESIKNTSVYDIYIPIYLKTFLPITHDYTNSILIENSNVTLSEINYIITPVLHKLMPNESYTMSDKFKIPFNKDFIVIHLDYLPNMGNRFFNELNQNDSVYNIKYDCYAIHSKRIIIKMNVIDQIFN